MEYDETKYEVRTWQHWANIHWLINPGLAVSELIFGIRIPSVTLIDIKSDKPLIERQFIPCPHCSKLNDARIWWSSNNKTYSKNWFGLYCPNCGGIIPCLINLTSLIFIGVTFPIWIWFIKSLKKRWLENQPARYENISFRTPILEKKLWIKRGLGFGAWMFVIMSILLPLIKGEKLTLIHLCLDIVIWTLGGLGWGYWMKIWMDRANKKLNKKGNIL